MARGKYTVNEVEERSKVPGSTLRQWERRYGFPKPERSDAGYRLYSDEDLNHIEAMKRHIAQGIPASRAADLVQRRDSRPLGPRSLPELQRELTRALVELDETRAEGVVSEACALYALERVVLELLHGSMTELGRLWQQDRIGPATEHFASAYVLGRLHALYRLGPLAPRASATVVACAPGEHHEIGALSLAILFRRAGYRVVYLGADTPVRDLVQTGRRLEPLGVFVSAAGEPALRALQEEREQFKELAPVVAFGGRAFNEAPDRATALGGVYLGPDAARAVERFQALAGSSAVVRA